MNMGNSSLVTEFILVGLTKYSEIQLPLFFLFLGIYIVTVAGNVGLVTLIGLNSHLHTPMYYFLFNYPLSTSVTLPSSPQNCWSTLCQS